MNSSINKIIESNGHIFIIEPSEITSLFRAYCSVCNYKGMVFKGESKDIFVYSGYSCGEYLMKSIL